MKQWYKKDEDLVEEIVQTVTGEDELAFWYIGQCGFIFKKGQFTFAIDPVLNDLLDPQGNTRRLYPAGMDPSQLFLDFVLYTHGHRDHLAVPTLQALYASNPDIRVIAPAGCTAQIVEAGIPHSNIVPLHHQQNIQIAQAAKGTDTIHIEGIRTAHPAWTENPGDDEPSLAMKITTDGITVLHPGDTYLCPELVEDLRRTGPVDLFFPPINGSDYFRTARGCIGNLNPYEAVRTAQLVEADMSIPCHYDMMSGNTCSPVPFIESMETVYPAGKYALPRLGERIIYRK